MKNLLCIGGIFDGQRKQVSDQIWHRFVTQTSDIYDQVLGQNEIEATSTLQYEEYRTAKLYADGMCIEFLIPHGMTDSDAFKLLFTSYESVRQTNASKKG